MIDNKNQPAFPISEESTDRIDQGIKIYTGLTKRELIASQLDVSEEIVNRSISYFESLLGRSQPSNEEGSVLFWAEAEAKLRVIKADALLSELSKP